MSAEKALVSKQFKRKDGKTSLLKDDHLKHIDVSCERSWVETIYNTAYDCTMEGKAYTNRYEISRVNCTDNEVLHNMVVDNSTSVDSSRYLSSLPDIGYAYQNRLQNIQEYIIHDEAPGNHNDYDQCSDKCGDSTSPLLNDVILSNLQYNSNKLVDLLKIPNEKSKKYSAELCRVKTKVLPVLLDSLKMRERLLFCSLPVVQQSNGMYCRQRKDGLPKLSTNTRRIRHEMRKRAEERYNRTCVDDSSADESKM